MEDEQPVVRVSSHLRTAVVCIVAAIGGIIAVFLMGFDTSCLLSFVVSGLLICAGISALIGLFQASNRQGSRLWKHVGVLLAAGVLLYLGSGLRLVDLRTRVAVALTGGQEELRTWAVALLDQSQDHLGPDNLDQWDVPREYWSEQVRRLKPTGVFVEPLFENKQAGVRLTYGGGFFHWQIVIGRPGSRPDPSLSDPNSDNWWLQWSDGIYDWQQG